MDLIEEMLRNTKSIAVIGAKPMSNQPAYTVTYYMAAKGYKIYPVNPFRINQEEFGKKFIAKVSDIEDKIDLINIFRRPEFLIDHAKEILEMKELPKYVWFQLGIRNDDAAKMLEDAGIKVVQNRCIMVEHSRYL
jgi:predicted CoA-binding protein